MNPTMKKQPGLLAMLLIAALTLGLSSANAQDGPKPETVAYIDMMDRYLEISSKVVQIAGNKDAAVHLALEGINEIYEKRRDGPGAERHLRELLDKYGTNQTVRNLIRFKLRDVYKETGQVDKALAELETIIAENTSQ